MERPAYWMHVNGFGGKEEGAGTNLKEARKLALAWFPKAKFIVITKVPFDEEGWPVPDEEDTVGAVYPSKMIWEDAADRRFRLYKDGSLGRRI